MLKKLLKLIAGYRYRREQKRQLAYFETLKKRARNLVVLVLPPKEGQSEKETYIITVTSNSLMTWDEAGAVLKESQARPPQSVEVLTNTSKCKELAARRLFEYERKQNEQTKEQHNDF